MTYLDYSATTKMDKKALKRYNFFCKNNFANYNSNHLLGTINKNLIMKTQEKFFSLLELKSDEYEIVFTSGSSESNNLFIKGLLDNLKNKKVLTTPLEHPSVLAPISYLQKKGIEVEILKIDSNGLVDLKELEKKITPEVGLICVIGVCSELGIRENLEDIREIINKKNKEILFYSDLTQLVGKSKINFNLLDGFSFSSHKIYGPKGIGTLIKKREIKLEKQILGGNSISNLRSGTPCVSLIKAFEYVLEKAINNVNVNYQKVKKINGYLTKKLKEIKDIKLNIYLTSIPHILNISCLGRKSNEMVEKLSLKNIHVSSYSACSSNKEFSNILYELTNDKDISSSCLRISLSHKTTKKEINKFVKALKGI